jgi:soluble lytic murein transglycosylase-like protein
MLVVAAATALPPRVLPVLQNIEGGRVGAVHQNANHTQDYGVMQVDSIWLPAIAMRAGYSEHETEAKLISDPCFNIAAAALILRTYLNEAHGQLLTAIGDYHSHTPALNSTYQALAETTADRLFSKGS